MPTVLEVQWERMTREGGEERGTESFRFAKWGITLTRSESFYEIELRNPLELPPRVGLRRHESRRLRLSLSFPRDRELPARLRCPEHCRVDFMGGGGLIVREQDAVTGHVDWAEFDPSRGGTVWLSFRLGLVDDEGTTNLRGRLRTFVRDVIDSEAVPPSADDRESSGLRDLSAPNQ